MKKCFFLASDHQHRVIPPDHRRPHAFTTFHLASDFVQVHLHRRLEFFSALGASLLVYSCQAVSYHFLTEALPLLAFCCCLSPSSGFMKVPQPPILAPGLAFLPVPFHRLIGLPQSFTHFTPQPPCQNFATPPPPFLTQVIDSFGSDQASNRLQDYPIPLLHPIPLRSHPLQDFAVGLLAFHLLLLGCHPLHLLFCQF